MNRTDFQGTMADVASQLLGLDARTDEDGQKLVERLAVRAARAVVVAMTEGIVHLNNESQEAAAKIPPSDPTSWKELQRFLVVLGRNEHIHDNAYLSFWINIFEFLVRTNRSRLQSYDGRGLGPGMRRKLNDCESTGGGMSVAEVGVCYQRRIPEYRANPEDDPRKWEIWQYHERDWKQRARDYADACTLLVEFLEPSTGCNPSPIGDVVATSSGTPVCSDDDSVRKAELALQVQLFAMIGEEGIEQARIVLDKNLSTSEKMDKLIKLDPKYAGYSSPAWSKMLAVSEGAIRRSPRWKQLQSDLVSERQAKKEELRDHSESMERGDVQAGRRSRGKN